MSCLLGLGQPHLHPVDPFRGPQFGVCDAVACRHQIQLPGSDRLLTAQGVGVQCFALEQPGNGRQTGVGMWADLQGMRIVEVGREDQVYEAPRAHGPPPLGGQDPADRHTADRGRPALTDLDACEGSLLD